MERDELIKEIGKRIKNERRKQELSQEELSFRAGIHTSYFGCIERGEKCPTVETLYKISSALNVPLTDIIPTETEVVLSAEERTVAALRKLSPDKQEQLADIVEKVIKIMD